MAKDRRTYDDDDGRTIASMDGVERPSLFGHLPERGESSRGSGGSGGDRPEWKPPAHVDLTPEERRYAIWYALKYGLGIGLVYVVAAVLLILFLLLIWGEL